MHGGTFNFFNMEKYGLEAFHGKVVNIRTWEISPIELLLKEKFIFDNPYSIFEKHTPLDFMPVS